MATISSLTSASSSSSTYGSQTNGIGGLVSGLNTDEIIEGMTIATRSKIAKQKQNKTLLSWKTDAYRSITSKLTSFADKYTSYTSSTNLYSESFYDKSVITAKGENSKYVSVSGTANSEQVSILGVKQLAKDASFTTSEALSNNYIQTEAINYGTADSCTITGKTFTVEYGTEKYVVTMPEESGEGSDGIYANASEVAAGLTKALESVELNGDGTLSDVMKVTANGEKLSFSNETGNSLKIVSGDENFMDAVGITSGTSSIVDQSITGAGLNTVADINPDNLKTSATFVERMKGKSITFEYNGVKKTITFDDEAKLANEGAFKGYIQDELDNAFGQGRIELTTYDTGDDVGKIKFQTKFADSGLEDTSSVLRITSSSTGVLGESGALNLVYGATNKLNLSSPLEESGFKAAVGLVEGNNEITINGETITIDYKKDETSLGDIIKAIKDNEKAGVSISYQPNSDSFSITSTHKGASGEVKIGVKDENGDLQLTPMEKLLFGKDDGGNIVLNGEEVPGQDAKILVDFDGDGGSEPMEIARGTNSFTLDGMTISVNGTFGYEENTDGDLVHVEETESVTFEAKADTDKILNAIKDMVKDYNELVEASNSAVQEKRDRDYAPLTDEQKEEMSESEIASWEEKAKAGMLFGDSEMINLTNDLRFTFFNAREDGLSLSDIGITVSTNWKDNGKITLDESKLKTALEEDPDKVKTLFTEESGEDSLTSGGVMTRMKIITDKYAATTGATKGILVEKAGSTDSPSSLLKNTLLDQMNDIDDIIENLESKLSTERTRYQKQFTALEELVQKMNTQSGWLEQQFGSY